MVAELAEEDMTVVAEVEEDLTVVAGAVEDPKVLAGAEDLEDLGRTGDPLWENLNQEFLPNKVQRQDQR